MSGTPSADWRPFDREALTRAGQLLALVAAYVMFGVLGLTLAPIDRFVTLIWPPTGLSLAALLLGGYRLWPAVTVAAWMTNVIVGAPPLVALGIALGNTGEALVGALAVRSLPGFNPSLERVRDVVGLITLAGMASTTIGATIGVASLVLGGIVAPARFGHAWSGWWTGDLLGNLVVAPLVLTWAHRRRARPRPAAMVEGALLGAFLVASAAILFQQRPEAVNANPILLPYVLFLPLLWAALRFGVRGAATGMFLVAFAAVWGTCTGHGDFVRISTTDSLFAVHVFLIAASLASLFLGAAVCELREQAAVLRGIIDETPDALYVKDRLGRYVIANAACARMLGGRVRVPLGQDDTAVFPAEEARLVRERDQEIVQTGQSHTFDERLTIAGQPRDCRTTKAPHRDHAGQVIGVIGISRDITAQKRAEEERAELLAREQAARAEAQSATRAKDEFLAVLSHELRTPLQSMLGWTRMLSDPDLDPRTAKKGQEAIERNLRLQMNLIEDLLDVSRIVAGRLRLATQPVDLADIVESTISSVRAAVEAKELRLEATIEHLDRDVLGDPVRLQQIVSNLLSNAVKFTPIGGRIAVQLRREGPVARLTVEDSGCGISPEFVERVFDRFGQEDSSTTRSHDGLGLGLTIVRHLVELQGGTVSAASPGRGQGATFTLTLPLLSAASRAG
jgi:PAS domain S-box-containing protein